MTSPLNTILCVLFRATQAAGRRDWALVVKLCDEAKQLAAKAGKDGGK